MLDSKTKLPTVVQVAFLTSIAVLSACGKVADSISKGPRTVQTVTDVKAVEYTMISMNAKLIVQPDYSKTNAHTDIRTLSEDDKKALILKNRAVSLDLSEALDPAKSYELWVIAKARRSSSLETTTHENQLRLIFNANSPRNADLEIVPQAEDADDSSIISSLRTEWEWRIVEVPAASTDEAGTSDNLAH